MSTKDNKSVDNSDDINKPSHRDLTISKTYQKLPYSFELLNVDSNYFELLIDCYNDPQILNQTKEQILAICYHLCVSQVSDSDESSGDCKSNDSKSPTHLYNVKNVESLRKILSTESGMLPIYKAWMESFVVNKSGDAKSSSDAKSSPNTNIKPTINQMTRLLSQMVTTETGTLLIKKFGIVRTLVEHLESHMKNFSDFKSLMGLVFTLIYNTHKEKEVTDELLLFIPMLVKNVQCTSQPGPPTEGLVKHVKENIMLSECRHSLSLLLSGENDKLGREMAVQMLDSKNAEVIIRLCTEQHISHLIGFTYHITRDELRHVMPKMVEPLTELLASVFENNQGMTQLGAPSATDLRNQHNLVITLNNMMGEWEAADVPLNETVVSLFMRFAHKIFPLLDSTGNAELPHDVIRFVCQICDKSMVRLVFLHRPNIMMDVARTLMHYQLKDDTDVFKWMKFVLNEKLWKFKNKNDASAFSAVLNSSISKIETPKYKDAAADFLNFMKNH